MTMTSLLDPRVLAFRLLAAFMVLAFLNLDFAILTQGQEAPSASAQAKRRGALCVAQE